MYQLLRCSGSPLRRFAISQLCWVQFACYPDDVNVGNQLHLFRKDSAYVRTEVRP
jgi:hypothetical protein